MLKGFKPSSLSIAIGLLAMFQITQSEAAPWVDTSDIYLRADIQALADAGIITVPVNTYPLMWSGIGVDLTKAEPSLMSADLVDAFARVNFYYQIAIGNRNNTRIKATAASDSARFQHFGSDYREKGELIGSHEYMGERFVYKISASANYDPLDDKEVRLDDSYFAMVMGNWIVTASTLNQWWGPGFDSGLIKSNNARPAPSLMLSRNNAAAFETPWLSWVGPWTLTAGLSRLEEERAVANPLLWNFRGSIRPLKQLELGVSWTTMFCGEGEECGFSTFFDTINSGSECTIGDANCDPTLDTKIGNQMTGFDARYSDTWFNVPVGLYLERTCEDPSGSAPWDLAGCGMMMGADTRFAFDSQQYKLFFEYTDTMVACGTDQNVFNCFYEHSTYKSGSRYYGRALGSTYDSDAKVYALGLVGQFKDSHGLSAILRYAQLNNDGQNSSNEWAPQPPKEDVLMLEVSYRMPILSGMVTFGGTVSSSKFEVKDNETDATVFSSYEYRF